MDLSPLNGASLVYRGQEEHLPPHQNLHYPCVDNFVSAVLENEVLRSTGATALWTDWVTEQVALANLCR